ncbi:uncharacterized protein EAF01_009257 [Botrytis porri]|uniref:uncharacterized protein n=1 Tax=Botrytis porri TaxID=87229 RepID=UPI0019023F20|nr:uncharacterized protein EAF01_009257 [Botrytis porri]KAF7896854.1 hypothetical protein EAF01_009257 [Botrytis porri]
MNCRQLREKDIMQAGCSLREVDLTVKLSLLPCNNHARHWNLAWKGRRLTAENPTNAKGLSIVVANEPKSAVMNKKS